MPQQAQIEVELRSMFDEAKYKELQSLFESQATTDLGADDKDVYFFILPDKLVKVVNNVSKKSAKMVLKLTKIGQGSGFEEIEIPIDPAYIDKAVRLFGGLGFDEVQQSFQKRHNYVYKGVEMALKYSDAWGHHLELEKMVGTKEDVPAAEKEILAIAAELGVHVMSDAELAEFTAKKDKEYRDKAKK
jgi:predicted adenylyl cyclase CyaB